MPHSKKKRILFVSSEVTPFAKCGGLGDVCGALPKVLKARGHDVRIVMPRYWGINKEKRGLKTILSPMGVHMAHEQLWCEVSAGMLDDIPVYFIEHEHFFGRAGIYDNGIEAYHDNAARFGFFSRACIQLAQNINFKPDIIHANDWPTALVPAYIKIWERHNPFFKNTATVLSIHNIAHQGVFPGSYMDFLGLGYEHFTSDTFESCGYINFLKGGIFFADFIATVSPTHAEEILSLEGGHGLAPYLERRRDDIVGILNGVDYGEWDPKHDPHIPMRYCENTLWAKQIAKSKLQETFHLRTDPNTAVIGITSRLVYQKGVHLLQDIIKHVVHSMRVQFVILGKGEKYFEDFFGGLPAECSGKIGAWIGYTDDRAHLIQAGSDFSLMPSLFEPCGLAQLYSMRYGTLPIVRRTGGLSDTVDQYDGESGSGTGFCFDTACPHALYGTIKWALDTFYQKPVHIQRMRKNAMQQIFCWNTAAGKYEHAYHRAKERQLSWAS
jgi:starch synthase